MYSWLKSLSKFLGWCRVHGGQCTGPGGQLAKSWQTCHILVSPALAQDYPRGWSLPDGSLSMWEPPIWDCPCSWGRQRAWFWERQTDCYESPFPWEVTRIREGFSSQSWPQVCSLHLYYSKWFLNPWLSPSALSEDLGFLYCFSIWPTSLPTDFKKMVLSRQLFIPWVFEHLRYFTSSCRTASTSVSSEAKTTGTGLPLESSESRC